MIELSQEQERVVQAAVDFYHNSSEQVFQYSGKAGTGKSVVMMEIIRRLGLMPEEVAPMAYIGAAAIVLRTKGLMNAKTIHSWLFEPKWEYDYDNIDPYFNRPKRRLVFVPTPLIGKKLICIDEAGSVPYSLKKEIESRGIKIIAAGDLNQLPPVADRPAYLYDGKVHVLNTIMRQAQSSAIVYLADRILNNQPIHRGLYGDVNVIYEDELHPDMFKVADIVICGRNKTRERYNRFMRELCGIDPMLKIPAYGEQLICRKNNWLRSEHGISLANGLTGRVINEPSVLGVSTDSFHIDFMPNLFPSVFRDLKCDFKYFNAAYEDKDMFKSGHYRPAGELFELGYAITTHISQGSQFMNGIYISEYMNKNINRNLDYVGITRFSNTCIYVLKSKKFY